MGVYWDIFRYQLPLRAPLVLKGLSLSSRSGILIAAHGEGIKGIAWGEVAPLPGYSQERLDQAEQQLLRFLRSSANQEILMSGDWSTWQLLLDDEVLDLWPSVRFGLEMLFINWESLQGKGAGMFKLGSLGVLSRVPLLNLTDSQLDATHLVEFLDKTLVEEIKEIKVKIGRHTPRVVLDLLIQKLDFTQKLRIDAGASLGYAEALSLLEGLPPEKVAFLEEPLRLEEGIVSCRTLSKKLGVPFALDERLQTLALEQIPWSAPDFEALVIKPTLIGSMGKIWEFVRMASRYQKRVIISASYESPIGISFLSRLASGMPVPQDPGLDTQKSFSDSVLSSINSAKVLDQWLRRDYLCLIAQIKYEATKP